MNLLGLIRLCILCFYLTIIGRRLLEEDNGGDADWSP